MPGSSAKRIAETEPLPATETLPALRRLIAGWWVSKAVHMAAKLGIADLLAGAPVSVADLARATETHEPSLYRLLRALASLGIFAETEEGFELTPMAEHLRSDSPSSLRELVMMHGEPWHWRAWEDALHSVRTGEPAFDKAHGQDFFGYLRDHAGPAAVFDEAMSDISRSQHAAVVDAYDFSGIGHLVDVGGGRGTLLTLVLNAYPDLTGTLFDLPDVVEGARRTLERAGVRDRCQVVAGDFFESVPRADAYLLAHVVHDWRDAEAARILENCRKSIAPGGRLVLAEIVIPPGNEFSHGKLLDLEMLVCLAGRERTEAEYARLLDSAGFRLTQVVPTAGGDSAIEAVPAPAPGGLGTRSGSPRSARSASCAVPEPSLSRPQPARS
jgi:SAM-dependent methyltransferase